MAKIIIKSSGGDRSPQEESILGKGDRILFLLHSGIEITSELADTFKTVNSLWVSRKNTDTENTVKISKAEIEVNKEGNRHDEEMAKINHEWQKISSAAVDRDRRLTFIQGQIQKFQEEYDKYMGMETEDFLSDTVTSRLESLRKVIMELTKELMKV